MPEIDETIVTKAEMDALLGEFRQEDLLSSEEKKAIEGSIEEPIELSDEEYEEIDIFLASLNKEQESTTKKPKQLTREELLPLEKGEKVTVTLQETLEGHSSGLTSDNRLIIINGSLKDKKKGDKAEVEITNFNSEGKFGPYYEAKAVLEKEEILEEQKKQVFDWLEENYGKTIEYEKHRYGNSAVGYTMGYKDLYINKVSPKDFCETTLKPEEFSLIENKNFQKFINDWVDSKVAEIMKKIEEERTEEEKMPEKTVEEINKKIEENQKIFEKLVKDSGEKQTTLERDEFFEKAEKAREEIKRLEQLKFKKRLEKRGIVF